MLDDRPAGDILVLFGFYVFVSSLLRWEGAPSLH